jgi:hypothetical protein
MYACDLPMIAVGGGGRLRSAMAASINSLQINSELYEGKHPLAAELLSFLAVAQAAVAALVPTPTPDSPEAPTN